MESPDVPITCSGATYQSAESLALRRQVRLDQLASNQFNDLFITNPHFALMHTLLASSSDSDSDSSPDTPSANVSESPMTSHAYLLEDSQNTPFASSSNSEDQRLQDFDYVQFYDEFWQMTKFEYDLQCISSSDFTSESINKSELAESKF